MPDWSVSLPGQVLCLARDALVQQADQLAGEVGKVDADALVGAQQRIVLLTHLQQVEEVRVGLAGQEEAQGLQNPRQPGGVRMFGERR
jgi:hypothetical protein